MQVTLGVETICSGLNHRRDLLLCENVNYRVRVSHKNVNRAISGYCIVCRAALHDLVQLN